MPEIYLRYSELYFSGYEWYFPQSLVAVEVVVRVMAAVVVLVDLVVVSRFRGGDLKYLLLFLFLGTVPVVASSLMFVGIWFLNKSDPEAKITPANIF